jgi:hypothetical protein
MDDSDRILLGSDQNSSSVKVEPQRELQSEQHVTPEPRVKGLLVVKGLGESHVSVSYHWTVRRKVTTMTNKQASILLKVWIVECLREGVGLSDYLGLEYLVTYVLGGKLDPLEIRDESDRQSVLLGMLFLNLLRGEWLTLGSVTTVTDRQKQEIIALGWLPTKRTYGSWKTYYEPWKFLEVLAVPLDDYDERDHSTVRYSGYTKHYGNGGHISRTLKTPYDSELDGETTDREPPEFNLQEYDQYNHILLSIEREKLQRRFEQK